MINKNSSKFRVPSSALRRIGLIFLVSLTWNLELGTWNFLHAAGTTTGEFLRLPVGARASALEGAYSAVADEASGLYWNPATLSQVPGKSVVFMHALYVEESFFDYASFAQRISDRCSWGLGVQYFSAGNITETDETGTETGSTFAPNDVAVSLGYAHVLAGYSLGLTAKFIQSKIVNSASTVAGDFGILTPAYLNDKLKFSLAVTNVGATLKFNDTQEDLPLSVKLGSALKISSQWIMALDLESPMEDDPFAAFGTEYAFPIGDSGERALAARLGVNTKTMGQIDGLTGIAYGLGWKEKNMSLDYAIETLGDLSLNHRISLSFAW